MATTPIGTDPSTLPDHVDVLVVGAGVSGIGMACHLTRECPSMSYAIVESRLDLGGTWDLFTYPGIRSDSDMYTFGYDFKPWESDEAIAKGPAIKAYVTETANEYDVMRHITFARRVTAASWDADRAVWTVTLTHLDGDGEPTGGTSEVTCGWLQMCTGYYSYSEPYRPEFPGESSFRGRIEHPQHWPDDLQTTEQLAGKRVVIIGSGATAVTLLPALTDLGAHVTMLQRSPTWIFPAPNTNVLRTAIRKVLPSAAGYRLIRFLNTKRGELVYRQSRTNPEKVKSLINKEVGKALGDRLPMDPHFTPAYDPWDQRLCLSPDGDFFAAITNGDATVVTDHVETFDADGIVLQGGGRLDADIVVTATGLTMLTLGGLTPVVDGVEVDLADTFTYKGFMYSGVPNLGTTFGYINASWTLRADLIARYVCRLLTSMELKGATMVRPVVDDPTMERRPYVVDFPAGYMQRRLHTFPAQGDRDPWTASQSYSYDKNVLLAPDAEIDDGVLEFSDPSRIPAAAGR